MLYILKKIIYNIDKCKKNVKKQNLQFKRTRHFKTINKMTKFIERNHIRNFNSKFSENQQIYILYY